MSDRIALSKAVRFEVFKRDHFTCQYCGRHPPDVLLEVDHILAIANGGTNAEDNLTASCVDCNRGKGARALEMVPRSLTDRGAEIAESEAQLAGYRTVVQARLDRIENDVWSVVAALFPAEAGQSLSIRRDWKRSIKMFLGRLDLHEALDAADIAIAKKAGDDEDLFRYFCGVCWTKIKRGERSDG